MFKGGTVVPQLATALNVSFPAGPLGEIVIPGIAGGSGPFDLSMQVLVKDPAQVKGVAFSNAVKLHFLP